MHYYDVEEEIMMSGIDPTAGVTVQLGDSLQLPPAEGDPPPNTRPETWTDIQAGASLPTGWPAAVPVVPEAWDLQSRPETYTIQGGDTLSGVSATYLGAPERWKEIWNMQPDAFRFSHSPDVIFAGQKFDMPQEAADNMRLFLAAGSPAGKTPGGLTPEEKAAAKRKSLAMPIALGSAAALGIGALLYHKLHGG